MDWHYFGGEPLEPENQKGLLKLVKIVKEKFPEKNIWCYTGFNFEKDIIEKMSKESETTRKLISYFDIVVDGKFEENLKDVTLKFKGSSNQRTIEVQKTLKENRIVLHEFEEV